MTITLTPELEAAIGDAARGRGLTTEEIALGALREKFLPASPPAINGDHLSEWEQQIGLAAAQFETLPPLDPNAESRR